MKSVSIYQAEDNDKLVIVPVNREYGHSKKPVFYLKRSIDKAKPKYLTGLFRTDDPAVFSGDVKDPFTGMKVMLKVTFENGGERLTIEGAKPW